MPRLDPTARLVGTRADHGLFGGNVIATRTEEEPQDSFVAPVEALGVTSLRYPGGSLTEQFFDLSDPDAVRAIDAATGETTDFIPLSEIMGYAAETGRSVNIVIPTRDQLSETATDANGDRLPEVDAETLRGFVRDAISGRYGPAEVQSFEIGNEYWGAGQMNAAEYGRLSAEMTGIIDEELLALQEEFPQAAQTEILVQIGQNYNFSSLDEVYEGVPNDAALADLNETYGLDLTEENAVYGSGRINWQFVNNKIIVERFQEAGRLGDVDGIATHVYSKAPDFPNSRYTDISQFQRSWLEERPDLETHVTEWNQKAATSVYEDERDYGLYQSHEMLNLMEGFMKNGVDQAQVWPLLQNTANALAVGPTLDAPAAPGEMFRMMSETLPGKRLLDFQPEGRETEMPAGAVDVHGFAGGGDLAFYIASNAREEVTQTDIDVSQLVAEVQDVSIRVLGVEEGAAPGSNRSAAVLEEMDAAEIYRDGFIEAVLAPGEIMEVRMTGVTPTEAFAPSFLAPGDDLLPPIPPEEEDPPDEDVPAVPVDDGGGMDLGMGAVLLPLLLLAGLAGGF
ncbi:type I secretion protein [Roseovarius aquimarinus]|uniref:Type I secretion protein n=1 Tax=Roseovarius aquimarinus TaxID=1229156 RepID=A0ABW7IC70_9RHOB